MIEALKKKYILPLWQLGKFKIFDHYVLKLHTFIFEKSDLGVGMLFGLKI